MHELGILIELVKTVESILEDQEIPDIDAIVLEVGELSPMIPRYIEACYPCAVDQTRLANTRLIIEVIKAVGQCNACHTTYELIPTEGICPSCGLKTFEIRSGKEFMIKELRLPEIPH
jgi:hydrogenase nickel incorporation protein HypA/HybF